MSMYKVCPKCGAHLDHGEICRCDIDAAEKERVRGIRANDIVCRKSTGETFKVLGIDYNRGLVIPEENTNARYTAEEIELIKSCHEPQTIEQMSLLRGMGAVGYIEKS